MNIQQQLKSLGRKKAKLEKIAKNLLAQARAQKSLEAKLEGMVKEVGIPARDLVFALVEKFGVRLAGRRKGSRGRRKRTKITAELRDAVKKSLKSGMSMNAASKKFGISYMVVMKVKSGHYNKVK